MIKNIISWFCRKSSPKSFDVTNFTSVETYLRLVIKKEDKSIFSLIPRRVVNVLEKMPVAEEHARKELYAKANSKGWITFSAPAPNKIGAFLEDYLKRGFIGQELVQRQHRSNYTVYFESSMVEFEDQFKNGIFVLTILFHDSNKREGGFRIHVLRESAEKFVCIRFANLDGE